MCCSEDDLVPRGTVVHLAKWGIKTFGFRLVPVILRRVQGNLVLFYVGYFQKTDPILWLCTLTFPTPGRHRNITSQCIAICPAVPAKAMPASVNTEEKIQLNVFGVL